MFWTWCASSENDLFPVTKLFHARNWIDFSSFFSSGVRMPPSTNCFSTGYVRDKLPKIPIFFKNEASTCNSRTTWSSTLSSILTYQQRMFTYFVREIVIVWLTFCLTSLDSVALPIKIKQMCISYCENPEMEYIEQASSRIFYPFQNKHQIHWHLPIVKMLCPFKNSGSHKMGQVNQLTHRFLNNVRPMYSISVGQIIGCRTV